MTVETVSAVEVEETRERVEEACAFLGQGGVLADLEGITPDQLESMYAAAHTLYEQSRFDKAAKIFQTLCLLNHQQTKYFIGLGACMQMQKRFEVAIQAYAYAGLFEPQNPALHLNAAECLLALNQLKEAKTR